MRDENSERDANGEPEAPSSDRDEGDDKLVGTEPDAGAIDEPTTDSAQASQEARWALQEGLALGLVSIAGGLLIVFGLMQATGLVTLPGPLAGSTVANSILFVALGAILVAAFAYSQWRT